MTLPILRAHGVTRAGLFGSVARGDMRVGSDIDLLVEIKKSLSLFEFVSLQQKLSDRLGRHVDLVEYETVKPSLRTYIMQDLQPIL